MKLNKLSKILALSATASFASYAPMSTAGTVAEEEVNDSMSMAQSLPSASAHSVEGVIGTLGEASHNNDLDYYTFQANEGDVLSIDIDHGFDGAGSIDTVIAIIDADGNVLRTNDDPLTVDDGSVSYADSRIDAFTAETTGTYTVAVSTYPRFFNQDGSVTGGGSSTFMFGSAPGDYSLNISGITMRVKQINMEVKPGVKELAPLKPSSQGKIPVAILGSSTFDVSTIKEESLSFGSTGGEKSLAKCQKHPRDINRDGYSDLLCHFENSKAGFKSGDLEAHLKGETKAKQQFEARAVLKVIPTKRR